jgi:hypothetical protein
MHYGFASFLGAKNVRQVKGECVRGRNTIGVPTVVRNTLLVARLGTWLTMDRLASLSNRADILMLASPFRIEDSCDQVGCGDRTGSRSTTDSPAPARKD